MPRATKQNVKYAIGVLVRRQMTVSTRKVTALIGGSRRDITRLLRELRAEKGRRTWAQWAADNGLQAPSTALALPVSRQEVMRRIERWGSAATGREKRHRQGDSAPSSIAVEPTSQPHDRRLQLPPSAPPPLVCSICSTRYRPSYPGQPPCCLDSSCGTEYHRRRREGLL